MMCELQELQQWYEAQCDGDWEHEFGVRIATLDNPGWTVEIDVEETALDGRQFNEVWIQQPDPNWIHCSVSEGKFRGDGAPPMLGRIIREFLEWARQAEGEPKAHEV